MPDGTAAGAARRLGLPGHARDAQHLHLGPDGWLYGCHGVFTHSNVGKPGHAGRRSACRSTPAIWRYHPTRHVFEVFAQGTSNPWGLDFNDHGQAFTTPASSRTCFTSSRAAATSGRPASTSTRTPTTTSRRSPTTGTTSASKGPHAGNSRSDAAGGGHAHAGAMIYLGGDLAGGVPRQDLHEQHPRPAHERRRAAARRAPATSARTARTSCWRTTRGAR